MARLNAYRVAQRSFLILAGLSFALKLCAVAGAPAWLLTWALALTGMAAVAAAVLARNQEGWLDGWRLPLVLAGLWFFPSVYSSLGGDGYEYYVLVRSPLFDGDLDLENDYEALGYRAVPGESGKPTSRVQIGVGLLWMPFVLLAHLGASAASWLGASLLADGFSPLYQAAVTSATFLYGLVSLFLLERSLRRYYGPSVALLSVVALWLATPLHFYTVANPFMSHGPSVFAATLFVLAWFRARRDDELKSWFLAGSAGGLLCLVRAHHSVLLLLPLVDLMLIKRHRLARAAAYLVPPIGLGIFQLVIWWMLHGPSFATAVTSMNLFAPAETHFVDVILSPRHGLFTWTPVYVLAVMGWGIWLRRDRRLALLMVTGFVLSAFINSLFVDWWGSDAFGQRRLLSLTPLFAFGLGETVDFLRGRPLVPVACFLTLLIVWNLQFAYIYNSELVARKDQAVSLDRLTAAQLDVVFRRLVRQSERLPPRLWTVLYDNLKGVWLHEGSRSLNGRVDLGDEPVWLPILVGRGWYDPEREDGTSYRRSRGRRSWLRLPIRRPRDFQAVLRGRLEFTEEPVKLELAVNGLPLSRVELSPGWRDYSFLVPASSLRSGLNSFLFTYSVTPRQADPKFHGKNTVIAVDYLKLETLER